MIYTSILFFAIVTVFSLSDGMKNPIARKSSGELTFATTLLSLPVFAFLVGINAQRADYKNYLQAFIDSPPLFSADFFSYATSQHTEIGYNYFQAVVKTLGGSATVFFILFCFVSLAFRYKFCTAFISKRNVGIVVFAFLAHEFLRKDCVQIRNGFASAIVLYSFVALYKGRRFHFVLTVLLASCFHAVALVALPLVLVRAKPSKKYERFLLWIFICSFVLSVFFHVRTMLSVLASFHLLPPQIVTYLNWSKYLIAMSLTNPQLLKQYVIMAWILWNRKKLFTDKRIFFLAQIYLVSTVYYLLFRDFEILAGRFGSLFYAVECPLLVLAIEKSKRNLFLKKLALCGFYFCLFALNLVTYQSMLGWKPSFN